MKPPSVAEKFEDNSPWVQAKLFAFEQIREVERGYELEAMSGGKLK